uniref:hypothetical protein n=1 Tax=Klebsiella pneumoniae TaxID=573 RepID=UPI00358FE66B
FEYNQNLALSEQDRILNPLAFQVTEYRVDNDYSRGVPVPDDGAMQAQAQQAAPVAVPDPAPVPPADAPPAPTAPISTTLPQDNVTTLGEVRALKPDDEPLDLYRFKNPVKFGDNRFSRDWSE